MVSKISKEMLSPFNAGFTNAVDRSMEEKLRERKTILDILPLAIRLDVMAGTNTVDLGRILTKFWRQVVLLIRSTTPT